MMNIYFLCVKADPLRSCRDRHKYLVSRFSRIQYWYNPVFTTALSIMECVSRTKNFLVKYLFPPNPNLFTVRVLRNHLVNPPSTIVISQSTFLIKYHSPQVVAIHLSRGPLHLSTLFAFSASSPGRTKKDPLDLLVHIATK